AEDEVRPLRQHALRAQEALPAQHLGAPVSALQHQALLPAGEVPTRARISSGVETIARAPLASSSARSRKPHSTPTGCIPARTAAPPPPSAPRTGAGTPPAPCPPARAIRSRRAPPAAPAAAPPRR